MSREINTPSREGMCSSADKLLVAWYADDFTGAAATMEVLNFAGIKTALFLEVPTAQQLDQFPGLQGFGVASTARAQTPDWMDRHLPLAFDRIKALEPEIVHYKVCSTLDSAPHIGSIGKAIELGAACFDNQSIPVLVAAPKMRRYQCFGQLFAGMGDQTFRLDQHPVMARHPVTPMQEPDVAAHILKQSDRLTAALIPFTEMTASSTYAPQTRGRADGLALVSIDSVNDDTDAAAGRIIWENRRAMPFVIGSQGIEYALVEHWQRTGGLEPISPPSGIGKAAAMMCVSGSVSPTTASQIEWSKQNGFECIALDAAQLCYDDAATDREVARVIKASKHALSQGRDPLVYSAAGPDDPMVERLIEAVSQSPLNMSDVNQKIGETLGFILKQVLTDCGVRRAVVSGGDTSGSVTQQLGIFALTALAPTIPGASICRVHSTNAFDGLELALKGGQMGSEDYFGWVRDGGGVRQ
jgi:3-oxoisoapionate kinase